MYRLGIVVSLNALLALSVAAQQSGQVRHAQTGVAGGVAEGVKGGVVGGIVGGVPGGVPFTHFAAAEILPSNIVVKGAPFSAETVDEFHQVLSDGNIIDRKTTGAIYRDSEGRVRTERSLGIGLLVPAGAPQQVIVITDPVAGVTYALNPQTKTATKNPMSPRHNSALPPPPPPPPPPGYIGAAPRVSHLAENVKVDDLGKQNIEGVEVDARRITATIPAGQIGNVRPIAVVNETWFSTQLKVMVQSKHSDPRAGDNTFRLQNLRLGEPAATLFQVPPDYTLKEGPLDMGIVGGKISPAKTPKQ